MVRLVSPGGIEVLASDEAAPRLLAGGFAEAEAKSEPKSKQEPKHKTTARKTVAKSKGA